MPDKATVEATIFLSTPSARRATGFIRFFAQPSARRATLVVLKGDALFIISIHALREEGDRGNAE